jgi:hypothetical protein
MGVILKQLQVKETVKDTQRVVTFVRASHQTNHLIQQQAEALGITKGRPTRRA